MGAGLQGGDGVGIGKRFRRSSPMMSEINVTPFVDVMLVLLIIFMVTAPLMKSGVDIDLPKEETGQSKVTRDLVFTVSKNGAVSYHDELDLSDKKLEATFRDLARNPGSEIFIEADRKADYEHVMRVMAMAKRAGIERLGMVTEVPARGR